MSDPAVGVREWDEGRDMTLALLTRMGQAEASDEYPAILESYVAAGDGFVRVARLVRASLFLLVEDYVDRFAGATAASIVAGVAARLPSDTPLPPVVLQAVVGQALGDAVIGQAVPKGVRIIAAAMLVPHLAAILGRPLREVVEVAATVDDLTVDLRRNSDE